jgi:purine nucleosidase
MGGTIHHPGIEGIPTPIASANFWNDPEAAQIVLRSGAKITLVSLDVTMKVMLTASMRNTIVQSSHIGATIMQIADFYVRACETMHPGIAGCGLHDPLAVAVAEDKSLTMVERMCIDIELNGALTRGAVIAEAQRRAGAVECGCVHRCRWGAILSAIRPSAGRICEVRSVRGHLRYRAPNREVTRSRRWRCHARRSKWDADSPAACR